MDIFTSWWDTLSLIEQVFWTIAIPATLLFVIVLITTIIGGDVEDADMDVDANHDAHHGEGFHFISFKNLIGFFTIFAWSGLACVNANLGMFFVLSIAISCGLIMMTIMASIFYFMTKLTDSGTMNMRNAIGNSGKVYLTIPAQSKGLGKVQIKVQGVLRTLNAMTSEIEDIKTESIIEVIDVINDNILIVIKS